MPRSKKETRSIPAIIWRHVLGIVKSRMAQCEKHHSDECGPTDEDFSVAFGTAINHARSKGYLKGKGLTLSKKGEEVEKVKLADKKNAEKEREYRKLLGRRKMDAILGRSLGAQAPAGKKTFEATIDRIGREAKHLATHAGDETKEATRAIRKA